MFRGFCSRSVFAFGTLGTLLGQVAQPPIRILNPTNPNPMPGDARMNQFEDP